MRSIFSQTEQHNTHLPNFENYGQGGGNMQVALEEIIGLNAGYLLNTVASWKRKKKLS